MNHGRALTPDDVRVLVHNGNSASTMFADFIDFLRLTGTVLPMKNSEIAGLIVDALDSAPLAEHAAETGENLARDMEVVVEALHFAEED